MYLLLELQLTTSTTRLQKLILNNSILKNSWRNSILKDEIYKMWYEQRFESNRKPLKASTLLDEGFVSTYRAYKIMKDWWISFRYTTKISETCKNQECYNL